MARTRMTARTAGSIGAPFRLSRGAAAAAAVALAIALLALAPGHWGTAYGQTAGLAPSTPPPAPVTGNLNNSGGGTLAVPNAGNAVLTVRLPAGTVDGRGSLQFTPIGALNLAGGPGTDALRLPAGTPALPVLANGSTRILVSLFQLDVIDVAGSDLLLGGVAELEFVIPPDVLALALGNLDRVLISRLDRTGVWHDFEVVRNAPRPLLAGICSPAGADTLLCGTDAFSLWSISVVQAQAGSTTATQAAPTPPSTGGAGLADTNASERSFPGAATFALAVLAAGLVAGGRLLTSRR